MLLFDFAIELWCAAFDVCLPDPQIFDMPVEFCLEFMAAIRPYSTDTEREPFDGVIDKVDDVYVSMFSIHFECPNTCGIIDKVY